MYATERSLSARFSTMEQRANHQPKVTDLSSVQRKSSMNANQINGTIKSLVGKVQEQAGDLLGNRRQALRGLQRQVLGAAEKRLGDYQQSARRVVSNVRSMHL